LLLLIDKNNTTVNCNSETNHVLLGTTRLAETLCFKLEELKSFDSGVSPSLPVSSPSSLFFFGSPN